MREFELHRITRRTALIAAIVLAGAAVPAAARAQTPNDSQAASRMSRGTDNNDKDTDWGWVGLLGLVGLLGMRRREPDHHVDTTRTRDVNR